MQLAGHQIDPMERWLLGLHSDGASRAPADRAEPSRRCAICASYFAPYSSTAPLDDDDGRGRGNVVLREFDGSVGRVIAPVRIAGAVELGHEHAVDRDEEDRSRR